MLTQERVSARAQPESAETWQIWARHSAVSAFGTASPWPRLAVGGRGRRTATGEDIVEEGKRIALPVRRARLRG